MGGRVRYETRRARQRRAVEQRSGQIWPPDFSAVVEPRTLTRQVWDETTAASVPAVAKALHIYQMLGVMPMDRYRGVKPMRRPRLLDQPDLTAPGSTWFVQQHATDWLLSGNALHLVTALNAEGQVAAVRYYPARQWHAEMATDGSVENFYLNGQLVEDRDSVVHVRRGQRPGAHGMGWGIVEQHLATLDRAKLEEEAERQNLKGGGVPSVAVITPQRELTQGDADSAADAWNRKLAGPGRQPVILPNGTQVVPLGWSASDSEMIAARQMSLTDVANLTGMDPYWMGAPGSSHTYRSPGPLWLALLRMTLETPARLFEDAWSLAWMPRGQQVRFDRLALTRDDLQTSIQTVAAARKAQLMTYEEGRIYLGWDPDVPEPEPVAVASTQDDEIDKEGEDDADK